MLWRVYSVFDRVAEQAMPCFCAKNDGVAIRGFRQGLKDARADEFQLFFIGTFDDEKVKLDPLDHAEQVHVPDQAAVDQAAGQMRLVQ